VDGGAGGKGKTIGRCGETKGVVALRGLSLVCGRG